MAWHMLKHNKLMFISSEDRSKKQDGDRWLAYVNVKIQGVS
jgi:hypothetical protein